MRHYCTLFDINYLPNFLALYHSLLEQDKGIKIYAFCMDNQSFDYLISYSDTLSGHIECISLAELIIEFPVLSIIKQQRSKVEFYFTCSPFICSYVIQSEPNATYVTYLDADLFFFNTPEKIFQELGNSSVGIIAHRFYGRGKRYLKYGTFNVGWVSFKHDDQGKACLKSWKDKCEEWCFDYYDEKNERFGDQKYLDSWQKDFKGVKIIQQKGANLAPWNVGQYNITVSEDEKFYIDDCPLVFYHFASFKKVRQGVYTTSLSMYLSRPTTILKEKIYQTYLNHVSKHAALINKNINQVGVLNKNRVVVHQTFRQKLNNLFISTLRWYFNDYIYQ